MQSYSQFCVFLHAIFQFLSTILWGKITKNLCLKIIYFSSCYSLNCGVKIYQIKVSQIRINFSNVMNLDKWVCVENAETRPLRRLGAMGTAKYPTKLYMAYGRLPKPNCWRGACLWAEINMSPVSRNVRDTPMATAKMWTSTYDKSYVQEFPLYCITRSQCDLFSERKHFFSLSNFSQISLGQALRI